MTLDLGSVLLSWFRGLQGLIGQASDERSATRHLREFAVDEVGARLLAARSADDLDDRLDDLLASPRLFQINSLMLGCLDLDVLAQGSNEQAVATLQASLATSVDQDGLARLAQAGPLLTAWLSAQLEALRTVGPEETATATASLGPWVLTSPEIPVALARGLADGLRAGACTLALALAVELGRPLPGWLGRALVDRLLEGVRGHLRLLVAVADADVPPSVLPLDQRLDTQAILRRHEASRAVAADRRNRRA